MRFSNHSFALFASLRFIDQFRPKNELHVLGSSQLRFAVPLIEKSAFVARLPDSLQLIQVIIGDKFRRAVIQVFIGQLDAGG